MLVEELDARLNWRFAYAERCIPSLGVGWGAFEVSYVQPARCAVTQFTDKRVAIAEHGAVEC